MCTTPDIVTVNNTLLCLIRLRQVLSVVPDTSETVLCLIHLRQVLSVVPDTSETGLRQVLSVVLSVVPDTSETVLCLIRLRQVFSTVNCIGLSWSSLYAHASSLVFSE
ncbi:hypothetical protein DPMN_174081 [Dreissena polymorpha]|uniref:Uncharacterized protein n=1 Tax=Dreissena polymorpha TaxID=45954 RepID=A0A9D4E2T4_DREPO|nr:hypothetical protein DPMN_174081 [Dreissena polymorpha]